MTKAKKLSGVIFVFLAIYEALNTFVWKSSQSGLDLARFNLIAGSNPVFKATYRHLVSAHDRGSYAIASTLLAVAVGSSCSIFIMWRTGRRPVAEGAVPGRKPNPGAFPFIICLIALLFYFGFDLPLLRAVVGDTAAYHFAPLSAQNLVIVLLLAVAGAASTGEAHHANR